jgi:hypothetical protein
MREIDSLLQFMARRISSIVRKEIQRALSYEKKPSPKPKKPKPAPEVKKPVKEDVQARIIGLLKQKPGLRRDEIRRHLRLDNARLEAPLRRLVAGKKVKRQGVTRGTRYTVR